MSRSLCIILQTILQEGICMKRLILGTLLFSLWLWGFAKDSDVTTPKGIDQNVIISLVTKAA